MRALILVGGRATRLRPLTLNTPKAMTPLLGRPFLEHMLAWLRGHGINDVTLLLGHMPDPIRTHFGDGQRFGVKLSYVVEDTPLGSGGAIKQLEQELPDAFFALNGDIFTDLDLGAMLAAHRAAGAEGTISLVAVDDPSQYGVVATDAGGWITRFVEKPPPDQAPSNLVNAGAWLFEPAAVARIAAGRASMVEQELFPELARAHRLLGYSAPCYWMDAGTPARYLQLHRDLLTGQAVSALAVVQRPDRPGLTVELAPGVASPADPPTVDPTATLDGRVVLGDGARIGAAASVVGPATVGASVVVQDGATVVDSVLWDGCRIGPGARIASSVLAAGCVIGAGATLDDCILGDGARVLPNVALRAAVVDPGTVIGDDGR